MTNNCIWVLAKDFPSIDFVKLKANNINLIFLRLNSVEEVTPSIQTAMTACIENNIAIHAWILVLRDAAGWHDPLTIDSEFLEKKKNDGITLIQHKDISGIHLDYIRYPGNATKPDGVTNVVTTIADAIHTADSTAIVSGTLMPEPLSKVYGQDAVALSTPLDCLVPMVYKGNYNKNSVWIGKITEWYKSNINEAKVIIGLQTYKSDDDTTPLVEEELQNDIDIAYNAKADGISLFRYGLINDFIIKDNQFNNDDTINEVLGYKLKV